MLSRRAVVAWVISLGGVATAVACSSPDFVFGPKAPPGDASAADDSSDVGDDASLGDGGLPSVVDASDAAPAAPLKPIDLSADAGVDFGQACKDLRLTVTNVFTYLHTDGGGKRHCFMYFAANPYRRSWPDAKVACGAITASAIGKTAHFATFSSEYEAIGLQDTFQNNQVPWIGLELVVPDGGVAPAVPKRSDYAWVTREPFGYDGWFEGHPVEPGCVAWVGDKKWSEQGCFAAKGFVCELDE